MERQQHLSGNRSKFMSNYTYQLCHVFKQISTYHALHSDLEILNKKVKDYSSVRFIPYCSKAANKK